MKLHEVTMKSPWQLLCVSVKWTFCYDFSIVGWRTDRKWDEAIKARGMAMVLSW